MSDEFNQNVGYRGGRAWLFDCVINAQYCYLLAYSRLVT